MDLRRAIFGFLLSFVFLFLFLYLISGAQYFLNGLWQDQTKNKFSASVSDAVQNIAPKIVNKNLLPSTPKPEINAEAAISVESNLLDVNKTIFDLSSGTKLPIASLTKLMTAVIAVDNYDLSENLTVDSVSGSQDPMKLDVKQGDTMPAENFLEIMLVESSNRSAYTLSEKMGEPAFVDLMNKKAKEIGLKNTFFVDPTGLSDQDVSTANDLSKLAEYILKNYPNIVDISRTKELDVPKLGKIENTDELLGEIPDAVCSKTGFTNHAKGCLLLVVNNSKNNDYLINVILGANDRFSEMKKLINWSSLICN